ncbi:MAG: GAF domain-containing protein [Flammeovirgaceae bacterium]|nr:MAG: GAF domain-containing protein [Flammeovirgaceae bacterium]
MKIKARHISITLVILFMAGIVYSFFTLFQSEAQGIPNRFYLLLGISIILGTAAMIVALTNTEAMVVYREKKITENQKNQESKESTKKSNAVEAVRAAIKSARNPEDSMQSGLSAICKQLEAGQGAFYRVEARNDKKIALLKAGYALTLTEANSVEYEAGEGLIGQAAVTGQTVYLDEIPEGYVKIISGLGSSSPRYVLIVAAKKNDTITGIVEIASFTPVTAEQRKFVEEAAAQIAEKLSS